MLGVIEKFFKVEGDFVEVGELIVVIDEMVKLFVLVVGGVVVEVGG